MRREQEKDNAGLRPVAKIGRVIHPYIIPSGYYLSRESSVVWTLQHRNCRSQEIRERQSPHPPQGHPERKRRTLKTTRGCGTLLPAQILLSCILIGLSDVESKPGSLARSG